VALTGIALASNLGTFILYAMICLMTFVGFMGTKEFNALKHGIVPIAGLVLNVVMIGAILILNIGSGGTTQQATFLALGIAGVWLAVSVIYFVINSRQRNVPIVPSIRPTGAGD